MEALKSTYSDPSCEIFALMKNEETNEKKLGGLY